MLWAKGLLPLTRGFSRDGIVKVITPLWGVDDIKGLKGIMGNQTNMY
jgi:hypothetical protein